MLTGRNACGLFLVLAILAGDALAAAGQVDFAKGALAVGADGRERPLRQGADLDKGDTVRTDATGRAQIRFSDGAYVSLQPNTEFAIRDYNFDGKADGSERGLFSLARGALRTVTGLIGRVNRNRYQIVTPTATIGIRGTGGRVQVEGDGSTLVVGTSGIWTLSNAAGTIDIPAGTSARAPSAPGQAPQRTVAQPSTAPAQASASPAQADQRGPAGATTSLAGSQPTPPSPPQVVVPLPSGSGYEVHYSFLTCCGTTAIETNATAAGTATATFNSAGQLTQWTDTGGENAVINGATHQEFGSVNGVMAWGRWSGGTMVGTVNNPGPTSFNINPNLVNEGYHYIVGVPATLVPTTGTAIFNLIGATQVTTRDATLPGSTATVAGNITLNFAGGANAFGLNFSVIYPAFTYTANTTLPWTAGQTTTGPQSITPVISAGVAPAPHNCSPQCFFNFQVGLFGPGASHAGMSYTLTQGNGATTAVGVAAFQR